MAATDLTMSNIHSNIQHVFKSIQNKQIYSNDLNKSIDVDSIIKENCVNCSNETLGLDENMNNQELSDIQKFYHGKNVLITGATGFLGKILMEKLLRSCPGVENLYLLVRQKRGKDIYTRIEETFDDPIFNVLKEVFPKFRHKVVVIPADCESAGLGLTITDRQTLIEKVNVIIHSAATVKFDEHLRAALATNVLAPLHLLELAKEMRGLKIFMHISTAYSNPHLPRVEERFYPCDSSSELLQAALMKMTDEEIDVKLPEILGPWPNTYTFTKALAERELHKNRGDVPLVIFRPAIVISTAKEPLKCWLDNMYGPTGVVIGSGTGFLRTLQCDGEVTADIVPVDMVVNCLIAAAVIERRKYDKELPAEPPVYNYVSSPENRLSWKDFMDKNIEPLGQFPFSNAVWYFSLIFTRSALLNNIYILFLHLLPAFLVDTLALCIGKKPKMLQVYKKIHKFSSVLTYFCTHEIVFCNRRTQQLWLGLSEADKKMFPFSMSALNWDDYFRGYIAGIRRYMFKESDDTLPQARIKWRRLYYLHQIVRHLFLVLVIYMLWSCISLVLS